MNGLIVLLQEEHIRMMGYIKQRKEATMEQLEIINKDGSGTGIYKDRNAVHRDGDLHASSHVWVVRDDTGGGFSVLLQQRSSDKDAFPNCFDTSCAGHVARGDTYETTAMRELEEELGIKPRERLEWLFDQHISWEAEFHGARFINNEIDRIYVLKADDIDLTQFQKEEISGLCWQKASDVLAALLAGDSRYCIQPIIFERFMEEMTARQEP